jgi:hypothetical protein
MRRMIVLSLGLGLVTVGGLHWRPPQRALETRNRGPAYSLTEKARPALDTTGLVTAGIIGAGGQAPLLAGAAGYVRATYFAGGDYARPGQLLVKLDNHAFVVAPRAGFLGPSLVRAGQYLRPSTPVTTLSRYPYLVVTGRLPPSWLGSIHPGDSTRIWSAARPTRVVTGVIIPPLTSAWRTEFVEIRLSSHAPFRIGEQVVIYWPDKRPASVRDRVDSQGLINARK